MENSLHYTLSLITGRLNFYHEVMLTACRSMTSAIAAECFKVRISVNRPSACG